MSAAAPAVLKESPPRKKFTRAEMDRMVDLGVFVGERYELIEGDLIDKMGQKPPHATAIRRLLTMLAEVFGLERVQVQLPIEVSAEDRERSIPEPDLAVLRGDSNEPYRTRHPNGDELALVIEVADTTLKHDSTVKRSLYARAGIAEYWILDISSRKLHVYRAPDNGEYKSVMEFKENESVSPESRSGVQLPVARMLA